MADRVGEDRKGPKIDGNLIRELRRRLGMTQGQLAEQIHVDQGTISRWERGVESPRPARRAALSKLLLKAESRRAMLRSLAFVRQDYLPSTLLDSRLRLLEVSASGARHFRQRGLDPESMIGLSLDQYAVRVGNPEIMELLEKNLTGSGLLKGDALLFRFVRNRKGKAHATVYEPIFEDGELIGLLNFVTAYFELPDNDQDTFELIETVRADNPSKAIVLHRGPNAKEAAQALHGP